MKETHFTWRIGFAYSLLGYSQEQMDEFNKALYQVITAEKRECSLNLKLDVSDT